MKFAIIGSRSLTDVDISKYVPDDVDEIISGGAKGIDTCAEQYADKKRISKHILRPKYACYPKKAAPIKRNELIIEYCDEVLAFWNGKSKGTKRTIEYAEKQGKKVTVICIAHYEK